MGSTRILIVDDHELFRTGLRSFLESRPNLEICGEASDALTGIAMARELRPDVILMDISLPVLGGLEATRMICREMPSAKVIILSQHNLTHIVAAAEEAGAKAYIMKSHTGTTLFPTLDIVLQERPFQWEVAGEEPNEAAAGS